MVCIGVNAYGHVTVTDTRTHAKIMLSKKEAVILFKKFARLVKWIERGTGKKS